MKLTRTEKNQLASEITTFLERFEKDTEFGAKFKSSYVLHLGGGDRIGFSEYYSWHNEHGDFRSATSIADLTEGAIGMINDKLVFLVKETETKLIKEAKIAITRIQEIRARYELTIKENRAEEKLESNQKLASKVRDLETALETIAIENTRLNNKVEQLELQIEQAPRPRRSIFC